MKTTESVCLEIGKRYGKLTVVSYYGKVNDGWQNHKLLECVCDCGRTKVTRQSNLRAGRTRSCGCICGPARKHPEGESKTPEIMAWRAMIQRCTNQKHPYYAHYGGRGISVCDEWMNSYKRFLDDMGRRPDKTFSLERRNNSLGYCKENCFWATSIQQNNNTRQNRFYSIDGVTMTVAQWARKFFVPDGLVRSRLTGGWTISQSLGISSRKDNL